MAGLDVVDGLSHVPVCYEKQCFEGIFCHLDILSLYDSFEVELHLVFPQFPEPQDDTPALDGFNDLRRCVATEDKPRGLTEVANDHP